MTRFGTKSSGCYLQARSSTFLTQNPTPRCCPEVREGDSPNNPLSVGVTRRQSNSWVNKNQNLRHERMRKFYRLRGDFAHGNLDTRQPATWSPLEHIILATIAFPLLVRCHYSTEEESTPLSDEDEAQIDAFEHFADEEFLRPPAGQKSSIDSRLGFVLVRKQSQRPSVERWKSPLRKKDFSSWWEEVGNTYTRKQGESVSQGTFLKQITS